MKHKTKNKSQFTALKNLNLKYVVEYKYDEILADDHNTRCANDYCRCSRIEKIRVTDYNLEKIAREYITEKCLLKISIFERLLNIYLKDVDDFEGESCGGYYGEEVQAILICESLADKIEELYIKCTKLKTLKKQVQFLLKEEYGYLQPWMENAGYYNAVTDVSNIIFPCTFYYKKLDKNKDYTNYGLIGGICKKVNDKYEVVDGYHRISQAKGVIPIIVINPLEKS